MGQHAAAQTPRNIRGAAFGMILEPLGEADRACMMRVLPPPVRILYRFLIERPGRSTRPRCAPGPNPQAAPPGRAQTRRTLRTGAGYHPRRLRTGQIPGHSLLSICSITLRSPGHIMSCTALHRRRPERPEIARISAIRALAADGSQSLCVSDVGPNGPLGFRTLPSGTRTRHALGASPAV